MYLVYVHYRCGLYTCILFCTRCLTDFTEHIDVAQNLSTLNIWKLGPALQLVDYKTTPTDAKGLECDGAKVKTHGVLDVATYGVLWGEHLSLHVPPHSQQNHGKHEWRVKLGFKGQ